MQAIIFALISYIGWGAGDIFTVIGSRKMGGLQFALWGFLAGLVLSSLYIPFAINDLAKLTPDILIINVALGFLFVVAWYWYSRALEIGNASLVGTIGSSFAALVVVLSVIFLKEKINPTQSMAIAVILIGLVLATLNFKVIFKKSSYNKGTLLALATMILWGIYFTFIKIPVNQIGWFWPGMISAAMSPILILYIKVKGYKLGNPLKEKALVSLLASTTLVTVGTFSFNFAISRGLTSLVAPISGSYPTFFVFLAFLVFKDKITKQQLLGIIVALIGIVLLSVFSS